MEMASHLYRACSHFLRRGRPQWRPARGLGGGIASGRLGARRPGLVWRPPARGGTRPRSRLCGEGADKARRRGHRRRDEKPASTLPELGPIVPPAEAQLPKAEC
jgi:hypothetical protein